MGTLTAIALTAAAATAQTPPQPAVDAPVQSVVRQVIEAQELPVMAAGLLDTIGGRLSGTPQGRRAERWAVGWLEQLGFDSVWTEPVAMPVWVRGRTRVGVRAPPSLRHRELIAVAYAYSPSLTADSVPVVDVGRGDPSAIAELGSQLEGAALLVDVMSSATLVAAERVGAAALLRMSMEPGRLAQARAAPVSEGAPPVPIVTLSFEDGAWLRRQIALGPVALELEIDAKTRPGRAANVVGLLRGSDPTVRDQFFVLGAHLDAWDLGDGAIDNGTGVLAVLGASKGLAAAEARPRRDIRVVLFAGEELGLRGSRAYVDAHRGELGGLVAMMNLDMVGAPEGYGATGHNEADSLFARLADHPALRPLGLSAQVEHGGGAGSDHQPFLLAGVPTIYVRTSLPPDVLRWYHNAGDTLDKIDLGAVRRSGAAAAAAAWALADHPGRPLEHLTPAETEQLVNRLGWRGERR